MQSSKGCVRLRDALKCIGMHLGGHCYSRVELLTSKCAEKSTVASAADCEVEADSLTAGHERKHNACRAESEVVLVGIPISAESWPDSMHKWSCDIITCLLLLLTICIVVRLYDLWSIVICV